jgi:hypothetical protein
MERALDRKQQLEGVGGIRARGERVALGLMTRSYALHTALAAVRSNPEFAEKVRNIVAERLTAKGYSHDEAMRKANALITWAKQSRMVMSEPDKVAQGIANMLKNASLSERVTLVDSFARSDFGKDTVKAGLAAPIGLVAGWLGERLSAHGHTNIGAFFSTVGDQFDGRIRAPAAFSIAAENNPFSSDGVRPLVTPAYMPMVRTGVLHPPHSAEQPVIRQHDHGGDVYDVKHAYDMHRSYGTPEDLKEFRERLGDYMWIVADPYDPGFKLSNLMEGDRVVIDTRQGSFEVSRNDLDEFVKVLGEMGIRDFSAASPKGFDMSPADFQPSPEAAYFQQSYMDELRERIEGGDHNPQTVKDFLDVSNTLGKQEEAAAFLEKMSNETEGDVKVPWWASGDNSEPDLSQYVGGAAEAKGREQDLSDYVTGSDTGQEWFGGDAGWRRKSTDL